MVFRHYGQTVNPEDFSYANGLNPGGISMLNLSEIAENYGYETVGLRLNLEQLSDQAPLPAVLLWNQYHFVVLYKISNGRYYIADPASGKIEFTKKEFLTYWTDDNELSSMGIALLLEPGENFKSSADGKMDTQKGLGWRMLYKHVWKYKKYFVQIAIGLILGSLMQLILPFLTQSLVDVGIGQKNLSFIYLVIIGQTVLFTGRLLIEIVRNRLLFFISSHINITILSDFWIKLMKLPLNFFQIRQSGDILQRVADHHRIEQFLTGGTINTLFSLSNLVVFSVVLYTYDHNIFLIFMVANVFYFVWIKLFMPYRRKLDYRRFAVSSRENSATMQLIYGMQDIKLSNSEHAKRTEWESLQSAVFSLSFSSLTLEQLQQAGAMIISESKNIIITLFVAKAVMDGSLTLGTMIAIQYIVGQLSSPVDQLLQFFQQAQNAKLSLNRLNEIHMLQDEEPADREFKKASLKSADIIFKNLTFTYPGSGEIMTLDNLSFSIPSGKMTAIVGMSGSGKSTILKLLMQFYLAYKGDIMVGEDNLRDLSPSYWRSKCGCVMQEGYIFNDSIENNITIGSKFMNNEHLLHACRLANILPFIESLPLGFKTKIGNEGSGLSQGQKQRLLIARAVYKNPEFLFFDEATNSLDSNNESTIVNNLNDFFRGRTAVVIAHRLSTVQNADKIIVLHDGQIVEEGNHIFLIERKGQYYELVKNQFQNFRET